MSSGIRDLQMLVLLADEHFNTLQQEYLKNYDGALVGQVLESHLRSYKCKPDMKEGGSVIITISNLILWSHSSPYTHSGKHTL